jgi:hypothetical protein
MAIPLLCFASVGWAGGVVSKVALIVAGMPDGAKWVGLLLLLLLLLWLQLLLDSGPGCIPAAVWSWVGCTPSAQKLVSSKGRQDNHPKQTRKTLVTKVNLMSYNAYNEAGLCLAVQLEDKTQRTTIPDDMWQNTCHPQTTPHFSQIRKIYYFLATDASKQHSTQARPSLEIQAKGGFTGH